MTDDPEPIRLSDSNYRMLYQTSELGNEGRLPWEYTEIPLATSTDSFQWKTNATNIQ
jgi:hypothetical protein